MPSLEDLAVEHTLWASQLLTITEPIASGKNTVAELVAHACARSGRTVTVVDVDDVAAMVGGPGAGAAGLWFAAHEAHGALVARWLGTGVDLVVSVGPFYDAAEQHALYGPVSNGVPVLRVLVHADLAVTWARAAADPTRGLSRQRDFHTRAHARYLSLRPGIATDRVFDTGRCSAASAAAEIHRILSSR